jgi:hypothetical protein
MPLISPWEMLTVKMPEIFRFRAFIGYGGRSLYMKNPEGKAFERLKKNKLIDNDLNTTAQGISTPACLEATKSITAC